ncbi:MAG: hypothetical protein ACKVOM_01805 [Ferruginibacter sp.]
MKEFLTLIDENDMSETLVEELQSLLGFPYADYLTWHLKARIELIKGKIFKMIPAPLVTHQAISMNLISFFNIRMDYASCKLFCPPIDVNLIGTSFKKRKIADNEILLLCNQILLLFAMLKN